jgi:hypothetical protein
MVHVDCSHKYQELPLIPVEDFLSQHPEHADDDENALMIARIDHERAEREALEQQRQELLKRKAKLISDNKRRRDDLANLDKDLEKFIDVSSMLALACDSKANTMVRPQNRSRSSSRKWSRVRLNEGIVPRRTAANVHQQAALLPVRRSKSGRCTLLHECDDITSLQGFGQYDRPAFHKRNRSIGIRLLLLKRLDS